MDKREKSVVDDEHVSYYKIISECCSQSTSHGLPNLFKHSHKASKIFWLFCTLASMSVGFWLVAKSIMDYYNYDTVTVAKVVFETKTFFPTVTICNQNMLTTEKAFEFAENFTIENGLVWKDGKQFLSTYFFSQADFVKYSLGVVLLDSNYSDEFRKSMDIPLEDMIIRCYYNNGLCSSEDFHWFFDPFYGFFFLI